MNTFNLYASPFVPDNEFFKKSADENTGLSVRAINRYKNDPDKAPPLRKVVLLCLALKLEPDISQTMLRLTNQLNAYDPNAILWRKLLREKYTFSIDEIDEYLIKHNLDPISYRSVLEK